MAQTLRLYFGKRILYPWATPAACWIWALKETNPNWRAVRSMATQC